MVIIEKLFLEEVIMSF